MEVKKPGLGIFSIQVNTFMQENPQSDISTIEGDTTFISESIIRAAEISMGKTISLVKKTKSLGRMTKQETN